MKSVLVTAISVALLGCAATGAAQAQAQQTRMKSCAAEWKSMKAANQTEGKTYRDFQKECLSRTAAPAAPSAAPAATTAAPAAPPAASTGTAAAGKKAGKEATKESGGRQAMVARERACGADWKAAKAAGTVPAGMTWPKYWSECNTRKKAQGM